MTNLEANSTEPSGQSILAADRRRAERFPSEQYPFWLRLDADSPDSSPASVRDVSATGIGLLVKDPIKPGTVLVITLQSRDHRLSRPLPLRVMHATLQPDGHWLVGCRFVRALSAQDLQALVGED